MKCGSGNLIVTAALLTVAVSSAYSADGGPVPDAGRGVVEFRVNGEAVTREELAQGVRDASALADEVCPTDEVVATGIRKARLIKYLPVRQFLKKEGIVVPESDIDRTIAAMKADPNPLNVSPPRPLLPAMVRQVISMDDLRLLVLADLGMSRWAEQEAKKRWPGDADWAGFCRTERDEFCRLYGKFARLSFGLSPWPKGARDETGALEILAKQAGAAKARLDRGEDFMAVAAAAGGGDSRAPRAALIPFGSIPAESADVLRGLKDGEISAPVRMQLSWDLFKREPLSDAEISVAIRERTLVRLQADMLKRIASETRVVEEGQQSNGNGDRIIKAGEE